MNETWSQILQFCSILRNSNKSTIRRKTLVELKNCIDDDKVQLVLYRKQCWGYILATVLFTVRSEFENPSIRKTLVRGKALGYPKLESLQYLRSYLKMAERFGNTLQMQQLGNNFLKKVMAYIIESVDSEVYREVVEVEYLQLLAQYLSNRMYCQALNHRQVHLVSQLVLRKVVKCEMENSCRIAAVCLAQLWENTFMDLFYDGEDSDIGMDRYFLLIDQYVDCIPAHEISNQSGQCQTAFQLIRAMNAAIKSHGLSVAPILRNCGKSAVVFVMRSWNIMIRKSTEMSIAAEFCTRYLALARQDDALYTPQEQHSIVASLSQMKDLLLNANELGEILKQVAFTKSMNLDTTAMNCFALIADVANAFDRNDVVRHDQKKQKNCYAIELIIDEITAYCSQAQSSTKASIQVVPWFISLFFYIARHPTSTKIPVFKILDILVDRVILHDIDDDSMIWVLEIIVLLLVKLHEMTSKQGTLKNGSDMCKQLWDALLRPDLPYCVATINGLPNTTGGRVLHVLSLLTIFDLVEAAHINSTKQKFFSLPVFRNTASTSIHVNYAIYGLLSRVNLSSDNDHASQLESQQSQLLSHILERPSNSRLEIYLNSILLAKFMPGSTSEVFWHFDIVYSNLAKSVSNACSDNSIHRHCQNKPINLLESNSDFAHLLGPKNYSNQRQGVQTTDTKVSLDLFISDSLLDWFDSLPSPKVAQGHQGLDFSDTIISHMNQLADIVLDPDLVVEQTKCLISVGISIAHILQAQTVRTDLYRILESISEKASDCLDYLFHLSTKVKFADVLHSLCDMVKVMADLELHDRVEHAKRCIKSNVLGILKRASVVKESKSSSEVIDLSCSATPNSTVSGSPMCMQDESQFDDFSDEPRKEPDAEDLRQETQFMLEVGLVCAIQIVVLLNGSNDLLWLRNLLDAVDFSAVRLTEIIQIISFTSGQESFQILVILMFNIMKNEVELYNFLPSAFMVLKEHAENWIESDMEYLIRRKEVVQEANSILQHAAEKSMFCRTLRIAVVECMAVYFRVCPTDFPSFVEKLFGGATDVDFYVRMTMCRNLHVLFYAFPTGHVAIFDKLFEQLPIANESIASAALRATSLVAIAFCLVASNEIEVCCLRAIVMDFSDMHVLRLRLLRFVQETKNIGTLANFAVEFMARTASYEMFANNNPITIIWLQSYMNAFEHVDYKQYAEHIIPLLCLNDASVDNGSIKWFVDGAFGLDWDASETQKKIILAYFPSIVSHLLLVQLLNSSTWKYSAWYSYLTQLFPNRLFHRHLQGSTTQITVCIFDDLAYGSLDSSTISLSDVIDQLYKLLNIADSAERLINPVDFLFEVYALVLKAKGIKKQQKILKLWTDAINQFREDILDDDIALSVSFFIHCKFLERFPGKKIGKLLLDTCTACSTTRNKLFLGWIEPLVTTVGNVVAQNPDQYLDDILKLVVSFIKGNVEDAATSVSHLYHIPRKVSKLLDKLHLMSIDIAQKHNTSIASPVDRFISQNFNDTEDATTLLVANVSTSYFSYLQSDIKKLHRNNEMNESRYRKLFYCLVHQAQKAEELSLRATIASCLGELGSCNRFVLDLSPGIITQDYKVLSKKAMFDGSTESEVFENILLYLARTIFSSNLKTIISCIRKASLLDEIQQIYRKSKHPVMAYLAAFGVAYGPTSTSLVYKQDNTHEQINNSWLAIYLNEGYRHWLLSTASHMADTCSTPFFQSCAMLCAKNVDFAERLFPALVVNLISTGNGKEHEFIESQVYDMVYSFEVDMTCMQLLLRSLAHIRQARLKQFIQIYQGSRRKSVNKRSTAALDLGPINDIKVARAALRSKMPCTAIFHAELACNTSTENKPLAYSILMNAFFELGDSDGLEISLGRVQPSKQSESRILRMKSKEQWEHCLPLYDAMLDSGGTMKADMASMLQHVGYNHLLSTYLERHVSSNPNMLDKRFEMAWRCQDWNFATHYSMGQSASYNEHLYHHLRGLKTNAIIENNVQLKLQPLYDLVNSFGGIECSSPVYDALLQLQQAVQVEDTTMHSVTTLKELYTHVWAPRKRHLGGDSRKVDTLLTLEKVLLHTEMESTLHEHMLLSAKIARKSKKIEVASNILQTLKGKTSLNTTLRDKLDYEHAKVLWCQKEHLDAILEATLLTDRLRTSEVESSKPLRYTVLRKLGLWIANQRVESSQNIIEKYLGKAALEIEKSTDSLNLIAKTNLSLAEYMHQMHRHQSARIHSQEWKNGRKVAAVRQKELDACRKMSQAKQREHRSHIHTLSLEVAQDLKEKKRVESSEMNYLKGAIAYYGKCLQYSTGDDFSVVFQFISLWFANWRAAEVDDLVAEILSVIPSYKFVKLSYQLVSRIGNQKLEPTLNILLDQLCLQHPHHLITQLVSLKHGKAVEGRGAEQYLCNIGEEKIAAAKSHLDKLRRNKDIRIRSLVETTELLSEAYIDLALADAKQFHAGPRKKILFSKLKTLSGKLRIDNCLRRLPHKTFPIVYTTAIEPRSGGDYWDIPTIREFESTFTMTETGIHRPKIVYCVSSDGQRHRQLVKGHDDTRQDVVIQQAFLAVNAFLQQNADTKDRKLKLRTYKVVPLSPITGVLEWIEETLPFGTYLTARGNCAHERYHPSELSSSECREILHKAVDKKEAFDIIQEQFTPVFHNFFLEYYPDAPVWYARRTAYTRSVAVSSIVGYILGIGDRHAQNILIDTTTGELVHIDFGIVFDQGLALLTPETVPFRLTRDMVDGMGVSKCSGAYFNSCIATLKVLREHTASILTILEVFIHDPLYRWTLSPLKALQLQHEAFPSAISNVNIDSESTLPEEPGTEAAERALIRVRQKLQGYEDSTGICMSVEGHVKHLIQTAQDPAKLCRLFPGWSPWV